MERRLPLVKDILQRYAVEILPTKRSEQSDKSRIKTLLESRSYGTQSFRCKNVGRVFSLQGESTSQAFERACEAHRANIKEFAFIRHEATSRLFEKGLNVMEVATITGHKILDMLKRYTHLRAEDLAKILK